MLARFFVSSFIMAWVDPDFTPYTQRTYTTSQGCFTVYKHNGLV